HRHELGGLAVEDGEAVGHPVDESADEGSEDQPEQRGEDDVHDGRDPRSATVRPGGTEEHYSSTDERYFSNRSRLIGPAESLSPGATASPRSSSVLAAAAAATACWARGLRLASWRAISAASSASRALAALFGSKVGMWNGSGPNGSSGPGPSADSPKSGRTGSGSSWKLESE